MKTRLRTTAGGHTRREWDAVRGDETPILIRGESHNCPGVWRKGREFRRYVSNGCAAQSDLGNSTHVRMSDSLKTFNILLIEELDTRSMCAGGK